MTSVLVRLKDAQWDVRNIIHENTSRGEYSYVFDELVENVETALTNVNNSLTMHIKNLVSAEVEK